MPLDGSHPPNPGEGQSSVNPAGAAAKHDEARGSDRPKLDIRGSGGAIVNKMRVNESEVGPEVDPEDASQLSRTESASASFCLSSHCVVP